nr:39S ribosomal protein L28, mitochondrial-like [Cherax quadricarinatus]
MSIRASAAVVREALTKPWNHLGVFKKENHLSRVPEHYKKFFWEWQIAPKSPVHYIPKKGSFVKLPSGEVKVSQDVPLLLKFPKELHQGIWGGEAILKGFLKPNSRKRRVPHYWIPTVVMSVVYSEILDRYMRLQVTDRALRLIDEHYGFDNYILQTPPADLMSELALKLRREMLLTLVRGTLYPDNPSMKQEILDKYQKYIIPENEAEWFGLTLKEAATKQKLIEEMANRPQPLKHNFRGEFIEFLRNKEQENEDVKLERSNKSWLSRVNPFAKE